MDNKIQIRALHPFDHYGMVRRNQILTVTPQTADNLVSKKLAERVGVAPAPDPSKPTGEVQPSSASQVGQASQAETSSESDDGGSEAEATQRPRRWKKRRGK
jgi:hypothetical protein